MRQPVAAAALPSRKSAESKRMHSSASSVRMRLFRLTNQVARHVEKTHAKVWVDYTCHGGGEALTRPLDTLRIVFNV